MKLPRHLNPIFTMKPLSLFVTILCSTVSFTASAEIIEEKENKDTDEVMQVWGTEIVNDNSLLKNDIELKQADHLSDLLRDEAGVDVGGSHALNQSINIRGLSELDLDITIDGVDQSNNVFHHVGNLLINPDILQAVDLQVGKNSVINGGLGGGVAFETKDADDLLKPGQKYGARIYGDYGSNDYEGGSATVYGRPTEQLDFLVYYNYLDRHNPDDGDGNEQLGQDGTLQDVLTKFGWQPNEINRLELSYEYYHDKGDYTQKSNMGMGWAGHDSNIYPIKYTRESWALNHELDLGHTQIHSTAYSNNMDYNTDKVGFYNPNTGEELTNEHGITQTWGVKSLAETHLETGSVWHELRYGFEVTTQSAKKKSNGETVGKKDTSDSYSVYVEDEIEIVQDLFITPGVRYDYYKLNANGSVDGSIDKSFDDTSFGLAAKYLLTQEWTVKASATELFKGPALPGSFLENETVNHDENVKAETGVNYEAGIAYESINIAWFDAVGAYVNGFQTNIDDFIDDTYTGKYGLKNEGDVRIRGVESAINLQKNDFSGRLTYSHSDSKFTSVTADSRYVDGQAISGEVGDSFSLNLGYVIPNANLTFGWTSLVTLDLNKDVPEDTAKDGYDVHNISARWTPESIDGFMVTAGVENIFDEEYASHASYDNSTNDYTDYEPGRNYKVSLAYVF
ncbi:TonB-dependent receptor [Vibrio sp. SS-MA-C1-2]|uniref:TonB-dependent receptor domain-containing protein n=1 Tax=Vibrio sp. SS-MA-C1-2 TaxID=2908646 RepID=UPI001F414E7F|nr:TonB-dependent receptor [Vibrio sp. SS-MA-C1-2]UJF18388.1 TonB-dependent receptor [Vibrio sp. SS-MA-C1-2]